MGRTDAYRAFTPDANSFSSVGTRIANVDFNPAYYHEVTSMALPPPRIPSSFLLVLARQLDILSRTKALAQEVQRKAARTMRNQSDQKATNDPDDDRDAAA